MSISKAWAGVVFGCVLLGILILMAVESSTFLPGAQWFPRFVTITASVLLVATLLGDIRKMHRERSSPREESGERARVLRWLFAFGLLTTLGLTTALLGMLFGAGAWAIVATRLVGKLSWRTSVLIGVTTVGLFYILQITLAMPLPQSLLRWW